MNGSDKTYQLIDEQAKLLNLMPDAIILRDLRQEILFWNSGAEKLYGWRSTEAIGKETHKLLQTKFPKPLETIETEALKSGYWEGELVHKKRDNTPLVVTARWAVWHQNPDFPRAIVEFSTDITEQKQYERSQHLLTEIGSILSKAVSTDSWLANTAQKLVPILADWCIVHIAIEDKLLQPVAVAHADPKKSLLADALLRGHILNTDTLSGPAQILFSGQPMIFTDTPEEALIAMANNDEQINLIHSLGVKSVIIVPLITRGHTLGTITLVMAAESERQYTKYDLSLAEELARRVALAVDNSRLYSEAQQLNTELEKRVERRTADLKAAIGQLENSRLQLLLLSQHEYTRREEDHARIAREIHDELGQNLTGLKMDLAWLQKHISSPKKDLLQKFDDMTALVDNVIHDVRRIASELRPSILDDLGLIPAIEWQLQLFQTRSGIRSTFNSSVEKARLQDEDKIVIFRIFQEALTNIARHAGATLVEVFADEMQGTFKLMVKDNGRGIKKSEINDFRSFGLLGMKERVALRSGKFSIDGIPGKGTTVTVSLPLIENGQEAI